MIKPAKPTIPKPVDLRPSVLQPYVSDKGSPDYLSWYETQAKLRERVVAEYGLGVVYDLSLEKDGLRAYVGVASAEYRRELAAFREAWTDYHTKAHQATTAAAEVLPEEKTLVAAVDWLSSSTVAELRAAVANAQDPGPMRRLLEAALAFDAS